jgi:hypothetical protein
MIRKDSEGGFKSTVNVSKFKKLNEPCAIPSFDATGNYKNNLYGVKNSAYDLQV